MTVQTTISVSRFNALTLLTFSRFNAFNLPRFPVALPGFELYNQHGR
jgi:hypothetical protein